MYVVLFLTFRAFYYGLFLFVCFKTDTCLTNVISISIQGRGRDICNYLYLVPTYILKASIDDFS